jgi:tRNA A-37 threonylcarbamoyl transferase component Bud32
MNGSAGRLVRVTAAGVRWCVAAEHSGRLLDAAGRPRGDALSPPDGPPVKQGPHRTVYRVLRAGQELFWKHCRLANLRAWCRELLRPPKAGLEFAKARALAGRGIPTVVPLAWGRRRRFGPADSFLITEALTDSEPLDRFLEQTLPRRPTADRFSLTVALGRFVARLHDAGVAHPDPHPGNLLVRWPAGGAPAFHLIDVHAVRLGRPLSWRARRANLVLFNRWFSMRASRSDRLRFWRSYLTPRAAFHLTPRPPSLRGKGETRAGAPGTGPSTPETSSLRSPFPLREGGQGVRFLGPGVRGTAHLIRDLERRTWRSNLRFWRARDRRRRGGHRLRRVCGGGCVGFSAPDLDADWLDRLLADPDAPFRDPGRPLLKAGRSSTVIELTAPVGGVERPVVLKRFNVTSAADPWLALVRPTPALRSWHHGHGLTQRHIPTARPLAVLHRRRRGLTYEGYLLTEKLPDAVDLHAWVGRPRPPTARRELTDRLGRLVRELHRRRLSHRDLKAANVLITAPDADPQPCLIDLVGVAAPCRLSRRRRVQNLARLAASFHGRPGVGRTDLLRFLRAYQAWNLHGGGDWKGWWREVERATRGKVARNARRGRPLG